MTQDRKSLTLGDVLLTLAIAAVVATIIRTDKGVQRLEHEVSALRGEVAQFRDAATAPSQRAERS